MSFEDEHVDVFHNLEGAIVGMYQEAPNLLDAHIETALDHLIRIYHAEAQGKTVSGRSIRGAASKVAEQLGAICEVYLGRAEVKDLEGKPINLKLSHNTAADLTACLKRIKSSVKLRNKIGGRQGYLNFVTEFIKDTLKK